MSKLGTWSTTAGNNNATPPDGWPEGQAPSTINDCAREMMASIRTAFSDLQYFDAGNTPSYLTATTFSLGAADTTTFQVGRRVKLFDSTTLYGTIESVSATFVSVRLDSGALTASLSSVAVAVVGAANQSLPDQAYTFRNVIINGSMDVWQRGTSFSCISNVVTYTADRWAMLHLSDAGVNVTRSERSANAANVPTVAQCGQLLNHSLCVSVSAADATIAAGQYANLLYRVEGYDWRKVAHKPSIVSFWVNTNRTGTYAVAIRNSPVSATFVQNYTVTAASSWTRFAVTVPEAPTTVTWNYSQSVGCIVGFTLAAGTTYHAGAGNWTAGEYLATSNQTNFLSSAGNVFKIAGVQFHDGTGVLPLEVRPYAEELALCQRYYWRGLPATDLNFAAYTAQCIGTWPVKFPVTMRGTPALAISAAGATLTNVGLPAVSAATPEGCRLLLTAAAAGINCNIAFGANDFIEASAEF